LRTDARRGFERRTGGEKAMNAILKVVASATTLTFLTLQPGSAGAQELFKDKTITIVVGYSAGGGYDRYARSLARHFGKHVPGQPNVIVQNLPGAASLLAVRHLDANQAKDGTVMTSFDPGLITANLTPEGVPKVDFRDYKWIGALLRDIRVCYAWHATGVQTWKDLIARKEFLIGATARGSNAYVNGAILIHVLGAPVRRISGYPGSNKQRLALVRGELDGNCASWSAVPRDWIKDSKAFPLLRFSKARAADMPETVPYVSDLTDDPKTRLLLDLLNAPTDLGRPLIVAKQVPDANVNTLRKALEATLKDEAFLKDMAKQRLPLDPVRGEDAQAIVEGIYSADPALIKKMVEVLQ